MESAIKQLLKPLGGCYRKRGKKTLGKSLNLQFIILRNTQLGQEASTNIIFIESQTRISSN